MAGVCLYREGIYFSGLGFDAHFTRWTLSFYVYRRFFIESEKSKKLKDLKRAIGEEDLKTGISEDFFPAFNIQTAVIKSKFLNVPVGFSYGGWQL